MVKHGMIVRPQLVYEFQSVSREMRIGRRAYKYGGRMHQTLCHNRFCGPCTTPPNEVLYTYAFGMGK